MHYFSRSERVEIENGRLCRIVTATTKKGFSMDVAKIYESGEELCRNIDFFGIYGWLLAIPGESVHDNYHGTDTPVALDDWTKYPVSLKDICFHVPTESEKELILSVHPDFKWVMKKTNYSTAQIFKALKIFTKCTAQEMETLCSIGCERIALNADFYKAKNRKQIIQFLSRNPDCRNESLRDIRLFMSRETGWFEIHKYRHDIGRWNFVTFDEFTYCERNGIDARFYRDYKRMVEKAGHNLEDPFWHFPNDFTRRHQKVLSECRKIDRAAEAIRKAEARKAEAEKMKKLKNEYDKFGRMMKKFASLKSKNGNIRVYIPQSASDVQNQAKALHQCLIQCDYIGKVVAKECLLVFIEKDRKPFATAELLHRGKKFELGQFYGNQNLKNIYPKQSAKAALKNWILENNVKVKDETLRNLAE